MSTPAAVITWNKQKLARFRKSLRRADVNYKETFTFEGNEFLTTYAKYLLEYLKTRIK